MTLAEKLVAVAKELGAIGKDKANKFHGYNYVSAEKFIEVVRGPLMEAGIVIIPRFTATWKDQPSPKGSPGVASHLHANYVITDGKETIEAGVCGEGWDSSGDKAVYKAMTGAHKYLLRILFNLPMTDDPEADGGHRDSAPASTATPPAQRSTAQPPASGGKMSTQKQRSMIYAKAKGLYGDEDFENVFKPWLEDGWGTDDTREMTLKQAGEVIEVLIGMEKDGA